MSLLAGIYERRFPEEERGRRRAIWGALVKGFLRRYLPSDASLLDLGAGQCEFLNAAPCRLRVGIELNQDVARFRTPSTSIITARLDKPLPVRADAFDRVFASNVLEHLPDKDALLSLLREVRRVLKPRGQLLILGPNLRYLPGAYWDFFDHHVPLTDLSMAEALEICDFDVCERIPRFLPYTTKSELSTFHRLIPLYLRLRPAWTIFGKQMFLVARRSD